MNLGKDEKIKQPLWQRVILLFVLGYEGLGALLGGILLMLEPDGRLMEMPADMMHGTFNDFMVPGIILFCMGILGVWAFVSVLRRRRNDWFMAFLALGGFYIWFTVEIIVIRELHWLHLMWGVPVLFGFLGAIPLLLTRKDEKVLRGMLACGLVSSIWYVVVNVVMPGGYPGYSLADYTVSELSALGSPIRWSWVLAATPYSLLFVAFGFGVRASDGHNNRLNSLGSVMILYGILNFYWPPMHLRGVTPTLTDTLHITWAVLTVLFMIAMMVIGSGVEGRAFKLYTIVSLILLMVFGSLTGMESPQIPVGGPTPLIGLWERINIALFMLWIAVLSFNLVKKSQRA